MNQRKRYSLSLSNKEKEALQRISKQMGDISMAATLRRLLFEAGMVRDSEKKGSRLEDENQ
jgi:hypothetical protein